MKEKYSIGIDIGGTNTDIGLVDCNGVIIDKIRFNTNSYHEAIAYSERIILEVNNIMRKNNISQIVGIGIGAPNANCKTGSIIKAPNLNFDSDVPLKSIIEERVDVLVSISNDANAAAYGEMIFGGAKKMSNFILFTLGTGIGSGIVIDRKLVEGHDGLAGELGHSILIPDGRQCGCGRKGCLEQYASAGGIVKTCLEMINQGYHESPLSAISFDKLGCKAIGDAANAGDALAIKVLEYTGHLLGIALANAVTFSSPEAIFLMGGPMNAGDVFFNPIKKSFLNHLLFVYKDSDRCNTDIQLQKSLLNANDVAILGAAALVN